MAKAKNAVIAGDFQGCKVNASFGRVEIQISSGIGGVIRLDKSTVEYYELVNDEHRKSVSSGIVRGLVGNAVFGGVGMVAGALSAKSTGIYQVAIQFVEERKAIWDGKRSLLEVDDATYKAIVKNCF